MTMAALATAGRQRGIRAVLTQTEVVRSTHSQCSSSWTVVRKSGGERGRNPDEGAETDEASARSLTCGGRLG
jgi:hypothetical protein